jgi:DNA-binding CsgD family transcriptional regulator
MGKHGFAGFSERQLEIIQLRTSGVGIAEIAECLGIAKSCVYEAMKVIYRKAGIHDLALLTAWAVENGLDEPLPPETAETREVPRPKMFKQRIRLGRLRRAYRIKPLV